MTLTRKFVARAALSALLLAGAPAAAQVVLAPSGEQLSDPNAVLVEELVVVARDKGPPWWRVSDGDTTVYVLGAPDVLPKGQAWDAAVLQRRLQGAHTVILPFNNLGVGVLQAPGAAIAYLREKGPPLEARLPGGLRARFVAARERLGQPAKRYGWDSELVAAMVMVADYRDQARLTAADPGKTVARMAKAMKLKTVSKAYSAGRLIGAARRTPPALQRLCLEEVLASVEAGPEAIRAGGAAWAEGDPRAALAISRPYDRCVNAVPAGAQLSAQLKADTAKAIARALTQPGHAVAVVQMGPLLSEGGVLDRLRDQGFVVKTPGDA
jgi:uncharacterized protein YbaP (TraB family)